MRRGLIPAAAILSLGCVAVGGLASAEDAPPSPQPAPPAPAAKTELPRQTIDLGNGVTFEMVLIPAGEFDMGSTETERAVARRVLAEYVRRAMNAEAAVADAVAADAFRGEVRRRVRLTRPYWVATTETRQAVWRSVMGELPPNPERSLGLPSPHFPQKPDPSWRVGPGYPVTGVSWHDCQGFLKALNEKVTEGGSFRLPTEAEWEHACRAGSMGAFSHGDDWHALGEYAWYEANSEKAPHPVGLLKPNAWGLFDMHGNVGEWCSDVYAPRGTTEASVETDPTGPKPGERVSRGGMWWNCAAFLRSAARGGMGAHMRGNTIGFRLARPIMATGTPGGDEGAPRPGAADRSGGDLPGGTPPTSPAPAPKPGEPAPPVAPPAMAGDVRSWAKVAPEQVEAARKAGVPVGFETSIGMRFVLIPSGTFTMGSPETEEGRAADETQHEVTLTRPYYLGLTEVTNGQYRRFKPDHSSGEPGGRSINRDDQPVAWVSWDRAVAFAAWLSAQDGERRYRLPTEAEWERGCRAGTSSAFWWGPSATTGQANYDGRAVGAPSAPGEHRRATVPVGSLPENPWGLHEVHGNVAEWCADWYGDYSGTAVTDPVGPVRGRGRVLRGGNWEVPPTLVRAARRGVGFPEESYLTRGFRLAVSVTPK